MSTTTISQLNRDVLTKDPSQTIPNLGVAKVGAPQTPEQWEVLRYELTSFVCQGEYGRGLERIIEAYLRNLDQPEQPAVWVSGFYGSGKSHVVRVLEALWRDLEFPDGAHARGLVPDLPQEIAALLTELSTRGRQYGGLWSAAGTLSAGTGSGDSIRLALARIIFQAANLPTHYGPGRFVLWLRHDGYEAAVRDALARRGKTLEGEVIHLHVSPPLAESLIEAIPGFASTPQEAREALRQQFPRVDDIANDELTEAIRSVLMLQSSNGTDLPCSVIVWDELQQFIADESGRTLQVQEIVQECSRQFGSRLLFVATGQSALQGTSQLQKLQGRFSVRVHLSENDVEEVVRRVVLQKRPDAIPTLDRLLDRVSGEIDRHLVGTKIGAMAADRADLVADYPLLPVRRRFWEAVLRAVDASGNAGQLRTQLRIVQEATRAVADQPLGWAIPADAIYDQTKAEMLQSRILLRSVEQTIDDQRKLPGPDGDLRARLLATIFLISQLEPQGLTATGLRATPDALADLLVEDLAAGGAALRERVPKCLDALADEGRLMLVGGQYQLQTPESQEWERDYRARLGRIKNDDQRIASDRADHLRTAMAASLKGAALVQGVTKTKRDFALHFSADAPPSGASVPIWVRDEWTVTEKSVRDEAHEAGPSSPIVFAFLPRREADALKDALASYAAAKETHETRPAPATPEGIQARSAMATRIESEKHKLDGVVGRVIAAARVFQGGGNEVVGESPVLALQTALAASIERLFPKFAVGDQTGWDGVVKRANEGSGDPLNKLGFNGEVGSHPVCQEIRLYLSGQAKRGAEIRSHFGNPPYGWSQDTTHGALLALVVDGQVRAAQHGKPRLAKELTHTQIGQTEFVREGHTVTIQQRLALRSLLKETVGPVANGEEAAGVAKLLNALVDLGRAAGGPAPLPASPDLDIIEELRAHQGNAQLLEVHAQREDLLAHYHAWSEARDKAVKRLPLWDRLRALLTQAPNGEPYTEIGAQAEAIRAGRTLLVDPDPVAPLIGQLTDALRAALQDARHRLVETRNAEIAELERSPEWGKLPDEQWHPILTSGGLGPLPELVVGTEEQLLHELTRTPLSAWEEKITALPARAAKAREAAAIRLQPKAVPLKPPAATLTTAAEVETYLARLRDAIMEHVEAGHPVIL